MVQNWLKYFSLFFSIFIFHSSHASSLLDIATHSLEKNIVSLPQGEFLAAGGHQFGSLWTRDFCFSVPALLTPKRFSLVKNQLEYLIQNRREDGLIPLYADSVNPMKRVIMTSVNQALGTNFQYKITGKLRPYFTVNAQFPTIDANLLLLKASYEYYQASGDIIWWQKNQKSFSQIYNYYKKLIDDGLIVQGAFSDWQDSAKRSGKSFFTNLLFLDVSKTFQYLNESEINKLSQKIHETFYDKTTGLYFSVLGFEFISLDGILWALDRQLLPMNFSLYDNLKKHPLWIKYSTPGFAIYPSYPRNWLAAHAIISGLSEYHGNLTWSWLTAFASKVALKNGDSVEANRISTLLEELVVRDQEVTEIYFSDSKHQAFESSLYRSESPFSWGAAFIIEMIKQK
jgi:glycogen debranching enzyme